MASDPYLDHPRHLVRAQMLARRHALSLDEQHSAAHALAHRLRPLLEHCTRVGVYSAVRGELSVGLLVEALPERAFLWPRVGENRTLDFIQATPSELSRGAYGILEPPARAVADPRSLDAILVPGTAFTRKGGRLGMGGGYYDRFLTRLRDDCLRIGVGYHWQILDELPLLAHDLTMTHVVSDQATFLCEAPTPTVGENP